MKVVEAMQLDVMPLDYWNSENHCHVRATGYYCRFEDGHWQVEYDDDEFEYADDCVYSYQG